MAIHVRSAKADRLVRQLAAARGLGLTEAIEFAVENALDRLSFDDKVKVFQDRFAAMGKSGLKADKALYDSLNDE